MILIGVVILCAICLAAPFSTLPDEDSGIFLAPVRGLDPQGPADSFDRRDGGGQYHFGFSHAGQVRSEHRDKDGNVYGYYSYFRHKGPPTIVFYIADQSGVKFSSNDLPVAVAIDSAALPAAVRDTPIVADAKKSPSQVFDEANAEGGKKDVSL